ncbi:MAG: extracellular solute-binding protein [Alphaproteobacteria bacterium]|nr:extracellular solute-binding protein [Alphaproteobacteria bacterium]
MKILIFVITLIIASSTLAQEAAQQPAIALHGAPKYGPGFDHLDYADPAAPKGGTLRLSALGTFDSLNPFIVKGSPAAGMNYLRSGFVYESLMQNSYDEPFSLYGILAESIEVAPDRSWVAFNLRPQARWQDGQPVTAADVVWTFETLVSKGTPFFRAYWADVEKAEAQSEQRVKFTFKTKGNKELPLIIAEMCVLPKHYWAGKNFDETSLTPPLGSGPYKIGAVDNGRSIEYVRDPNWWGKDLPFFKGWNNFDRIRYDYYKDANVALEAFFAGQYDARIENVARLWEQAYDAPPVKDGRIKKEEIENDRPAGMQAFVFNIRRPVFQDRAVRQAISRAFDFEWSNKQFAFGKYVRTDSFFENSELAAQDLPSAKELALLERYRGKIPDEVFTTVFKPTLTGGDGFNRDHLQQAAQELQATGWVSTPDGPRMKDGVRLRFEILDANPEFERWVLPFIANLKRIGIEATYRVVDPAQYQNRINDFDFDMTISVFGQSDSPGNEQRDFWGSAKADMKGSQNIIGIKNQAIDQLVEELIHAQSREDLINHSRALDRILLWNHYVIPMWHYPKWRIAYWNTLARPGTLSGLDPLIAQTWWEKPQP